MAITDVSDRYYTYEDRLASFQAAQPLSKRRASNLTSKAQKSNKWPHSFLAPERMAKAGFFHYPTQDNPDNVVCFLCRKSMDGWEEEDDPLAEHLKHSPDCGWAIVASIDARNPLLSQEYPLSTRMIEARKATFGDRWPYENKKGWKCKIKQMVDGGWKYTPTSESDDMTTCVYCELALDGWEPSDKPLDEHHSRSPDCAFFVLIAEHQETTNTPKDSAKSRKPRTSKASRLSAQSTFTVTSEAPSIIYLPPEEDDSVLTTATSTTVISQSGKKMAKRKKPTKGRKTKTKKEETSEVIVDMEPEDADFEVKVELPKATRGKKRSSEEMCETSTHIEVQSPPAKRRGARNTRGSVPTLDGPLAPSLTKKDVDEIMTPVDTIVPEKAVPNGRRGRQSNAKSRRIVSSTSNAPKASSLRMAIQDDDEIDRELQADLERPLTDEEDECKTAGSSKSHRESRLKKIVGAPSTALVKKSTRSSKIHKDYNMFGIGDISIDDGTIDAELQVMEREETISSTQAKGAKSKQSRKASAKQQAAAKRTVDAAQAGANVVEDKTSGSNDVETGVSSSSFLKSREVFGRATRASTISMNESNISVISGFEESHDSGNDSDASVASRSTVVKGGSKRRGSSTKKTKSGKKAASRNIEEIIHRSVDTTASQEDAEGEPQKKRVGRLKKIADEELVVMEKSQHTASIASQEPLGQQAALKPGKAKTGKSKGLGKPLPDLPMDTEKDLGNQTNQLVPESPRQALKELTPPFSPQSSDAENKPPSSKPSTVKQASKQTQASRIPLAACTPTTSPSKRNIIAGLQSSHSWAAVDLDEILLHSPSNAPAEKENEISGLLAAAMGKAKQGELTSPEKKMTVEEWIMYNASLAEGRLKGECERMVGIFEKEGGRAMRVLEGIVSTD